MSQLTDRSQSPEYGTYDGSPTLEDQYRFNEHVSDGPSTPKKNEDGSEPHPKRHKIVGGDNDEMNFGGRKNITRRKNKKRIKAKKTIIKRNVKKLNKTKNKRKKINRNRTIHKRK